MQVVEGIKESVTVMSDVESHIVWFNSIIIAQLIRRLKSMMLLASRLWFAFCDSVFTDLACCRFRVLFRDAYM